MLNVLIDARKNTYYTKHKESGEYIPLHEIILILDKPVYSRTKDGKVKQTRGCEEVRFTVPNMIFDSFIETLSKLRDKGGALE